MEYLICKMTNTNSNKQYFVMMELKNREKIKEKSPYNKQQTQDWMKLNNKTSKTKKGEGNNPDGRKMMMAIEKKEKKKTNKRDKTNKRTAKAAIN